MRIIRIVLLVLTLAGCTGDRVKQSIRSIRWTSVERGVIVYRTNYQHGFDATVCAAAQSDDTGPLRTEESVPLFDSRAAGRNKIENIRLSTRIRNARNAERIKAVRRNAGKLQIEQRRFSTVTGSRFDSACRPICGSIVRFIFHLLIVHQQNCSPTKRSLRMQDLEQTSANARTICGSPTGVAMVLLIHIGWPRNAKFWLRPSPVLPA